MCVIRHDANWLCLHLKRTGVDSFRRSAQRGWEGCAGALAICSLQRAHTPSPPSPSPRVPYPFLSAGIVPVGELRYSAMAAFRKNIHIPRLGMPSLELLKNGVRSVFGVPWLPCLGESSSVGLLLQRHTGGTLGGWRGDGGTLGGCRGGTLGGWRGDGGTLGRWKWGWGHGCI